MGKFGEQGCGDVFCYAVLPPSRVEGLFRCRLRGGRPGAGGNYLPYNLMIEVDYNSIYLENSKNL